MNKTDCDEQIKAHRLEIRTLLHDTLAQTLFSASTLSGLIATEFLPEDEKISGTVLELDQLLKEAVSELKSIQAVLSNDDQSDSG